MRIAVGILGLMAGLLVILQSCAVSVGSNMVGDAATSDAGAAGLLVGFACFIGGAFAFGLPTVSLVVFALAALAAFAAAASGEFDDLNVWGFGALILAALSFVARRKGQKAPGTPAGGEAPQ